MSSARKAMDSIGVVSGVVTTQETTPKNQKAPFQCFMIQQHPVWIFPVLLLAVAANDTLNGGRRSHV